MFIKEQILIVENTKHLTSREWSARKEGQMPQIWDFPYYMRRVANLLQTRVVTATWDDQLQTVDTDVTRPTGTRVRVDAVKTRHIRRDVTRH